MKAGTFLTWAAAAWVAGHAIRCWMRAGSEFCGLLWTLFSDDETEERNI